MKRSSRVAAGIMGVLFALLTAALRAEEPAKKAETVKPPWQRLLQGDDALKAKEMQQKIDNLKADGKFAEGVKLAEGLLALRQRVQGAAHWETADARRQLETLKELAALPETSRQEFVKAAKDRAKVEHLVKQRQFAEAEKMLRQFLKVSRQILGEEHPDTAVSLKELSDFLYLRNRFAEAEPLDYQILAIRRKTLGEQHPSTAASLYDLANDLSGRALDAAAEPLYRQALAIQRNILGEENHDTAESYSRLAHSLGARGKYAEAEPLYRKSLTIHRKVFGEEHPHTATSYRDVAFNLSRQGKYGEAETLCRKALAIERKVLGEEHADTAISYNNLASILQDQGKYAEAEPLFRTALAVWRKVLGEEHPRLGRAYNNLAVNMGYQNKYAQAEPLLRKSLAIHRKAFGEEHTLTAASYNNLSSNLYRQGKFKEAEEGYRKAAAICRKLLGEEHPEAARGYKNLATSLHAQGRYKESEILLFRAADSFAKARMRVASAGLERATFTSEHSPLLWLAAVLARNGKSNEAWQRFEESLARGIWDDVTERLRRPQAERDQQAQIIARIDRLQNLIGRDTAPKPTAEQTKQRQERLTQLRRVYDELAAFTEQLERKYGPVAGQVFPRRQIQAALPADAALIAWLDLAGLPKEADPNGEHWAILLRSSGDPIWVRLHGSGDNKAWTEADTKLPLKLYTALKSADSDWKPLAERLRKQRLDPLTPYLKGVRKIVVLPSAAIGSVPLEVIADGYTVSYAHSATMFAHLLRQPAPTGRGLFVLADPVFDPPNIVEKLQPLPPGGVLLTMVLPGGNADKAGLKPNDVLLHYGDTDLNAAADLKPHPDSKDPKKLVPVIVWRDGEKLSRPLFVRPGKLGVVFAKEPAPQAVAEQRRINRLLASRSGDDGNWPRLPGTRIEAGSLQRLFDKEAPVQLLLDSDASEQRIDQLAKVGELSKYRYVHLATHGEVDNIFPLRSAVILSRDRLPDDKQRTELLLSGQSIPDGRLTAEDALRRWKLHADLVTLSACQTALGKYERGEGFVGFAQALILCGTRAVCLSLWKVDDVATALLMERFYQNLLGKRDGLKAPMAKAAALAEAKAWLRTLPRDEAVKRAASLSEGVSRGKGAAKPSLLQVPTAAKAKPDDPPFAHPRYWAAFILIGHAD